MSFPREDPEWLWWAMSFARIGLVVHLNTRMSRNRLDLMSMYIFFAVAVSFELMRCVYDHDRTVHVLTDAGFVAGVVSDRIGTGSAWGQSGPLKSEMETVEYTARNI